MLSAIIAEQMVPLIDAYRLGVLAGIAVTTTQTFVKTSDGFADLLKLRAYLVNARLFKKAIVYMGTTATTAVYNSSKFQPFTAGMESSIRTGDIGMFLGMKVKEVPSDILPANVLAVLVNPSVVSAPRFLDDSKVGESAAAFGSLLLCLYMYTCVVSTPKRKGVATITSV